MDNLYHTITNSYKKKKLIIQRFELLSEDQSRLTCRADPRHQRWHRELQKGIRTREEARPIGRRPSHSRATYSDDDQPRRWGIQGQIKTQKITTPPHGFTSHPLPLPISGLEKRLLQRSNEGIQSSGKNERRLRGDSDSIKSGGVCELETSAVGIQRVADSNHPACIGK